MEHEGKTSKICWFGRACHAGPALLANPWHTRLRNMTSGTGSCRRQVQGYQSRIQVSFPWCSFVRLRGSNPTSLGSSPDARLVAGPSRRCYRLGGPSRRPSVSTAGPTPALPPEWDCKRCRGCSAVGSWRSVPARPFRHASPRNGPPPRCRPRRSACRPGSPAHS
jgi:hypothetical protein